MKKFFITKPMRACPFCASENLNIIGHMETLTVECKCGAKIINHVGLKGASLKDVDAIIDKWNTREGVKQ